MKKTFNPHTTTLVIVLILLSLLVSLINPAYFSLGNLFKILKSSVETGIFAISFLIILILGGIDMSFPAIATISMYSTIKILGSLGANPPLFVPFAMAAVIGAVIGGLNGLLIGFAGLPVLIVTLGTMSIIRGAMLVFIGKNWITKLPGVLIDFSQFNLFTSVTEGGESIGLHSSVLILIAIAILIWALLHKTWFGRSIYAIGGNPVAAERDGIATKRVKFLACVFSGALAGVAGLIHGSLVRVANPLDIFGTELNVIAAVVLGGASLTGGAGTVGGTLLGVLLMNILNNSLIMMGIHSYWQRFVLGLIIVISTIFTANRNKIGLLVKRLQKKNAGAVS